ncbi:Hypothetical predicted protein [Marmota monax]|uniref:Uncharacterized protein n=1 Tax=Marmota monax TaxID=9995 RepID=A0A5E4B1N7_MARMO|nr:Hypothetical predicted protein [Marmota monax]
MPCLPCLANASMKLFLTPSPSQLVPSAQLWPAQSGHHRGSGEGRERRPEGKPALFPFLLHLRAFPHADRTGGADETQDSGVAGRPGGLALLLTLPPGMDEGRVQQREG